MGWVESISEAITYIENNITEEINIEDIAKQVSISPFYFQKGFAMLCGFTVGEYIRKRRLSLAGNDLIASNEKIINIALKYGYDSPDSFTKAFTRFHGVTPTGVRKEGKMVKSYASLKIKLLLKGGYTMDYKIVEKESFTVMGVSKVFKYENATLEVPKFWEEFLKTGKNQIVKIMKLLKDIMWNYIQMLKIIKMESKMKNIIVKFGFLLRKNKKINLFEKNNLEKILFIG